MSPHSPRTKERVSPQIAELDATKLEEGAITKSTFFLTEKHCTILMFLAFHFQPKLHSDQMQLSVSPIRMSPVMSQILFLWSERRAAITLMSLGQQIKIHLKSVQCKATCKYKRQPKKCSSLTQGKHKT